MKYYNEIVPHDLAVELKAAGFDEVTRKCYGYDNNLVSAGGLNNSQQEYEYQLCHFVGATLLISAPTYADVFDWLMNMHIRIDLSRIVRRNRGFVHLESWHSAANREIRNALKLIK